MSTTPSSASDATAPEYGTAEPVTPEPAVEPTVQPGSEPTPQPATPEPTARSGRGTLHRSERRLVAGVCGGIADYLGIDPTLVRLAFALLTVFGGSGVVVYAVGWLVMPDARGDVVAERLVERLQRR